MDAEPKDYAARSADGSGPSIELQQRAFSAVSNHPHYRAATAYEYCEPTVLLEPKAFLDRARWDESVKQRIASQLVSTDMILLLSYTTSECEPEPLAGHGKTYDFVLHPETLEVLHTSIGKWRS